MAVLIGILLALGVGAFASAVGLARERGFFATVTIVIASYYALFAIMGNSTEALMLELVAVAAFLGLAVIGFRYSLWVVVAALAAHGVFDFFRGDAIVNPGMPAWWPSFCLGFDIVAAGYLACLLKSGRLRAQAR